jgi:hypothetical protein
MALRRVLASLGRTDISVHGFRSSFRDWAAETTAYPREVAEMALAHAVGNQVETAYRRGDLFEKRWALMRDWSLYCGAVTAAQDRLVLPPVCRGATAHSRQTGRQADNRTAALIGAET